MWTHYCWFHDAWYKSTKGVRWHKRRWGCGDYVEKVPKAVSRQLEGLTRLEVSNYRPPE